MLKLIPLIFCLLISLIIPTLSAATAYPPALWITNGDDTRPLLLDGNSKLIAAQKPIMDDKASATISIRYPLIVSNSLSPAAKDFNQLTDRIIKREVNQFTHELTSATPNANLPNTTSKLTINYSLASLVSQSQHSNYISVRYDIDSFARGMAHPEHHNVVFNYDLGHNQPLKLAQLFKPGTPYLSTLANECRQELQQKPLPDKAMLSSGTQPILNNYKTWNVTLSGLLITFDEAQVAPRYFGVQQVLIPYSKLAASLTPQAACTLGVVRCDKT